MSENVRLTQKQKLALAALLAGGTETQAAAAAGVNPRTLARWRESEAFRDALRDESAALVQDALAALRALLRPAAMVLWRVLADDQMSAACRLRAAGMVLENVLRLGELVDHEARIAALERGAGDGQHN